MVVRSNPRPLSSFQKRTCCAARLLLGACLFAALTVSVEARAQSAADKATARDLAVQGIKKFEAGDSEGAVQSLERAQALYDAPVHLLYLGRAHARLGHLVEAAEAYRSLARAKIGESAPTAFRTAQIDGQKELEELEPRLAKLTIEVVPDVEGLEVTVDDKPINTAGLSVPRATNPGPRVVRATAPGYLPAGADITLEEGANETVRLTLEADPDAQSAEEGSSPSSLPAGGEGGPGSTNDKASGPMGLIVGLRLGGVLPVGELSSEVASTDYFQPGVGARGELGFRFLRHFGIKGYFGMGGLSPGGELDSFAEEQESGILAKNSGNFRDAGLLLMATTDPRQLGGFGELGMSFLHRYQWKQKFSGAGVDCTMSADYSGWAVRAGGGMNIPASRILTFVPAVDVSVGQFTSRTPSDDCPVPTADSRGVVGADDRFSGEWGSAIHYQIFLGFGADLHFGDSLFQ